MLSDLTTLLFFIATSVAVLIIPGPAVLYVVARSLERGWQAGIVSAFGLMGGAMIHILLVTVGVAALLQSSALTFAVMRLLGAAYIVYLGFKTIGAGWSERVTGSASEIRSWSVFKQGVLVNLSNPKAMLFFFAFLPQFVDPEAGALPGQLVALGAVFLVIAFLNDASWAILAGSLSAWMRRKPRYATMQQFAAGGILIVVGLAAAAASLW